MSVSFDLNRNALPNFRALCWAAMSGLLATWGAYLIAVLSPDQGWRTALLAGGALGEFPAALCVLAMLSAKKSQRPSLEFARGPIGALQAKGMTHDQYREVMRLRAANRNPLHLGLILLLLGSMTLFGWATWGWDYWCLPELGFFVLIAGFAAQLENPRRCLSSEEYYALTGSRDSQGQHRCLFCRGRGIYRHGEYGTNARYADCSKCGRNLYLA